METKCRRFARRSRGCYGGLHMMEAEMLAFARTQYCIATQRSRALEHMRNADLDGDGKIEEDEFLLWHASIMRQWPSIGTEFSSSMPKPNLTNERMQ